MLGSLLIVIGIFLLCIDIIIFIKCNGISERIVLLIILPPAFFLAVGISMIINFSADNQKYTIVKIIDNNKYIQCINGSEFIVSNGRSDSNTTQVFSNNESGGIKTSPCIEKVILGSETGNLNLSKDKMLIPLD